MLPSNYFIMLVNPTASPMMRGDLAILNIVLLPDVHR